MPPGLPDDEAEEEEDRARQHIRRRRNEALRLLEPLGDFAATVQTVRNKTVQRLHVRGDDPLKTSCGEKPGQWANKQDVPLPEDVLTGQFVLCRRKKCFGNWEAAMVNEIECGLLRSG